MGLSGPKTQVVVAVPVEQVGEGIVVPVREQPLDVQKFGHRGPPDRVPRHRVDECEKAITICRMASNPKYTESLYVFQSFDLFFNFFDNLSVRDSVVYAVLVDLGAKLQFLGIYFHIKSNEILEDIR